MPDLSGGGAERVQLLLAEEFLSSGHSVDIVIMRREGKWIDEVPPGCRIINLNVPRIRCLLPHLMKYFRREQPDAVLAVMWPLTGITGIAVRFSRPSATLVVSEHTDFRHSKAINKPLDRWLLRYFGRILYLPANRVVAVSEGVADSLVEYAGLSKSKISVINNPIRKPSVVEPEIGDGDLFKWWNEGDIKILSIGALKEAKSFDLLLEALVVLRQTLDVRLIILGEGHLRTCLESLVLKLDIQDSVRLPGFRRNPEPFYEFADVFASSSSWEGFGIVIAEALSWGVPVVSTDCPSGPSEILIGGRYGRLVPVGDKIGLARGIYDAHLEQNDREMLINRAEAFNQISIAEKYLALLSDH